MKRTNLKLLAAALLVVGSLGFLLLDESCGNKPAASSSTSKATSKLGPLTAVPLSITLKPSTSLNLNGLGLAGAAPGGVSATAVSYSLTGCASGLSGTPASQSSVNVYTGDTGCYVTMTQFTVNGVTYNVTNTNAVAYSPVLATGVSEGQGSNPWPTATFANSGGTLLVSVQSIRQLSSPVVIGDYVSYEFDFVSSGTNSNGAITVGQAQSLYTAGQLAPNFALGASSITLSSVSSGVGTFQFVVTCNLTQLTDGTFTSFCPVSGGTFGNGLGVDINGGLTYKLIQGTSLTLAQAQTAFATAGTAVTLPGQLNGTAGFTVSAAGPGLLATSPNQNMLLVLQATNKGTPGTGTTQNNSSYEYFAITYTPLVP